MDFRESIISQYLAALEMLRQAILACPETLWDHPGDGNNFAQITYHALFFTHLYVQESEQTFRNWPGHRDEYRFESDTHAGPPETPTKSVVFNYLAFCQREVTDRVSALVLDAPSGFDWLPFSKFELQIYSIRHIQQHVGELMERLGTRASEIDWIGQSAIATRSAHPDRESI